MKFYGDYHTHSRHSDGRQSEVDIIAAARRRGLKEVAITDHGPLAAVIGVESASEYSLIRERIDEVGWNEEGLRVLVGAEANIRDLNGTLDIPQSVIEGLDLLIAGMHPYTLPTTLKDAWDLFARNSLRHLGAAQREKAVSANTKACKEAIYQNPDLDILAHPGLFFTVDVQEIAQACVQKEVLFEINCGHEHPDISDIMEAELVGVDFIVNSDSHFEESVGKLDYGVQVVKHLKIDPERVVNLETGGGYSQWGKKMKNCRYS
ncbi:MAG: PHP domain-containing protein [Syntrophomonas sp.]|uniref:PHP domain-containing protein n=1 Tax=Syntrophomonas sp. TaxID=2053627 RepID=UPI0026067DE7|nr:PHP domain-containing protein [Syntrophomonas sp.]MDD2510203.1 PHP domain-containing protein [Syntrophomonas sp.]MDD3879235.1 PHP domain-containing protein [Syntrophomonas sp.]MDD4626483.1 PHP domain-containing protein [Syntrophomonas sp.]